MIDRSKYVTKARCYKTNKQRKVRNERQQQLTQNEKVRGTLIVRVFKLTFFALKVRQGEMFAMKVIAEVETLLVGRTSRLCQDHERGFKVGITVEGGVSSTTKRDGERMSFKVSKDALYNLGP